MGIINVTLPDGSALKLTRARVSEESPGGAEPGTVVAVMKKHFTVACLHGAFDVTEVVPQGKKKMDAASFINGRKIAAGDKLS